MEIPRLRYDPSPLLDYYEESLSYLGSLCERTWHDRVFVVPGGAALNFWRENVADVDLHFRSASDSRAIDPATEVFPGSPLTFAICDAVLKGSELQRVTVRARDSALPDQPFAERRWYLQYPKRERWQMLSPLTSHVHFSFVGVLRCEIQAVDQHWTQHRIAINLKTGGPDPHLAEQIGILEPWNASGPIDWPTYHQQNWKEALLRALEQETHSTIRSIRTRQLNYLQRELFRVDRFFRDYEAELTQRLDRSRTASGRSKIEDRLKAARSEHQNRRIDQIKRHSIRQTAHVDALLAVAEPAFETEIRYISKREEHLHTAFWLPRTRSWIV
jgi:hypothetical protein